METCSRLEKDRKTLCNIDSTKHWVGVSSVMCAGERHLLQKRSSEMRHNSLIMSLKRSCTVINYNKEESKSSCCIVVRAAGGIAMYCGTIQQKKIVPHYVTFYLQIWNLEIIKISALKWFVWILDVKQGVNNSTKCAWFDRLVWRLWLK